MVTYINDIEDIYEVQDTQPRSFNCVGYRGRTGSRPLTQHSLKMHTMTSLPFNHTLSTMTQFISWVSGAPHIHKLFTQTSARHCLQLLTNWLGFGWVRVMACQRSKVTNSRSRPPPTHATSIGLWASHCSRWPIMPSLTHTHTHTHIHTHTHTHTHGQVTGHAPESKLSRTKKKIRHTVMQYTHYPSMSNTFHVTLIGSTTWKFNLVIWLYSPS